MEGTVYIIVKKLATNPWRAEAVITEKRVALNAVEVYSSQDSNPKYEWRLIEGRFIDTDDSESAAQV